MPRSTNRVSRNAPMVAGSNGRGIEGRGGIFMAISRNDTDQNAPTAPTSATTSSAPVQSESSVAASVEVITIDDSDNEERPVAPDASPVGFGDARSVYLEDLRAFDNELILDDSDDDDCVVPPPKKRTFRGKPIRSDPTWGDCTMCSEEPIKPQGCYKCLQFLGCEDCVNRLYAAQFADMPKCPFCRNLWNDRPVVSAMKSIEKRLKKENQPS
ncbi:unnamed protein product [Caenorhabditis sp. 36 PRJEB53466]|nr:unnamed protein product [Caenorhabditis sp. 36 PRJEB53466]